MNPSIERTELSLSINEVEAACEVPIALEAAEDYGLTPREAESIVQEVEGAVAGWRELARELGIPKEEQELMSAAFGWRGAAAGEVKQWA